MNRRDSTHAMASSEHAPGFSSDCVPPPSTQHIDMALSCFGNRGDSVQVRNYSLSSFLGGGSFGKVYLAENNDTREIVAVKEIIRDFKHGDIDTIIHRECTTMHMESHPHIIKIFECMATASSFYIVMELAVNGDLNGYMHKNLILSDAESRKLFHQLISAVDFCHRNKLCHRDLKPSNILLDARKNVKLADFGVCYVTENGEVVSPSVGSLMFSAPETNNLTRSMVQRYNGFKADIWSCGTLLHYMLVGEPPFLACNVPEIRAKMRKCTLNLPSFVQLDAEALMRKILVHDPFGRATMEDIFSDEWFRLNLPRALFPDLKERLKNYKAPQNESGPMKSEEGESSKQLNRQFSVDLVSYMDADDSAAAPSSKLEPAAEIFNADDNIDVEKLDENDGTQVAKNAHDDKDLQGDKNVAEAEKSVVERMETLLINNEEKDKVEHVEMETTDDEEKEPLENKEKEKTENEKMQTVADNPNSGGVTNENRNKTNQPMEMEENDELSLSIEDGWLGLCGPKKFSVAPPYYNEAKLPRNRWHLSFEVKMKPVKLVKKLQNIFEEQNCDHWLAGIYKIGVRHYNVKTERVTIMSVQIYRHKNMKNICITEFEEMKNESWWSDFGWTLDQATIDSTNYSDIMSLYVNVALALPDNKVCGFW